MPLPIISVAEMRDWENASWSAEKSQSEVISNVGKILAARIKQMVSPGDTVLVIAGKGHNGDDARAAVTNLENLLIDLRNITNPRTEMELIETALARKPKLIVDGLFGLGLNRPLDADWCDLIRRINESGIPILAVDVPSGLDADTGKPLGESIRASVTMTLGAPKSGLLAMAAWPYVGMLELASDIGLIDCPVQSELNWTLASDFTDYPNARPAQGHKGTFGHLAIVAGSTGFHGAAVLTSRGAQRAQPGLITLFTPREIYTPVASQTQSVMVTPYDIAPEMPDNASAVLIGPGLASKDLPSAVKALAIKLWEQSPRPVIVDASALDWLADARTNPHGLRVITPHPGEAARFLGISTEAAQGNRLDTLRKLSRKLGNCLVILKGPQTLIGRSAGSLTVNSSGNPQLAQGGSGDLLSGYLAGLLAQPLLAMQPEKALAFAVWQHGATAEVLSARHRNWTVEDLSVQIGNTAANSLLSGR